MVDDMRAIHLCNGLGGSLWTGAILGWESIYALDFDQWRCNQVIAQAAAGWWPKLRVECADLTHWQPSPVDGPVDVLAAGFSCRDISVAGKGAGLGGGSTGPTYQGCIRAIDYFRPAYVFFENSPEIRTRGLSQVLADLADRGYRARCGIIAASDVGAPHQRDRWYLLATAAALSGHGKQQLQGVHTQERGWDCDGVAEVADAHGIPQRSGPGGVFCNPNGNGADGESGRINEPRRDRSLPTNAADTLSERNDGWPDPATGNDHDRNDTRRQEAASRSQNLTANAPHPLRHGQQEPLQQGWLREAAGEAIEAAARYCGAYHWNPPHRSLCGVVDGLAYPRGDTGRYIAALGDAWCPLQAATAWALLGGPIGEGVI